MRLTISLVVMMVSSLITASGVRAQDTPEPAASNDAVKAVALAGNSPTPNKSSKSTGACTAICKVPVAAASLVCGTVVGTPIAMVRHSADEIGQAGEGMANGFKRPIFAPFFAIVGPTAIVLGGLGGLLEGPWFALENSGKNCFKKPFSKEAFSAGAMEEWDAAN